MSWKLAELRWRQDAGLRERSETTLDLEKGLKSEALGFRVMEVKSCNVVQIDGVGPHQLTGMKTVNLGSIRTRTNPHPPPQSQLPRLPPSSVTYHLSYDSSAPLLSLPGSSLAPSEGSQSASSELSAPLTGSIGSFPSPGSAPPTPQKPIDFLDIRDWSHLNCDQGVDKKTAVSQLRNSFGLQNPHFQQRQKPLLASRTSLSLQTSQPLEATEFRTFDKSSHQYNQQQESDWEFSISDLPDPVVPWSNLQGDKGDQFLTKHFFKHDGELFEVINAHHSFGNHQVLSPEESVQPQSDCCVPYHQSKAFLLPGEKMDSSPNSPPKSQPEKSSETRPRIAKQTDTLLDENRAPDVLPLPMMNSVEVPPSPPLRVPACYRIQDLGDPTQTYIDLRRQDTVLVGFDPALAGVAGGGIPDQHIPSRLRSRGNPDDAEFGFDPSPGQEKEMRENRQNWEKLRKEAVSKHGGRTREREPRLAPTEPLPPLPAYFPSSRAGRYEPSEDYPSDAAAVYNETQSLLGIQSPLSHRVQTLPVVGGHGKFLVGPDSGESSSQSVENEQGSECGHFDANKESAAAAGMTSLKKSPKVYRRLSHLSKVQIAAESEKTEDHKPGNPEEPEELNLFLESVQIFTKQCQDKLAKEPTTSKNSLNDEDDAGYSGDRDEDVWKVKKTKRATQTSLVEDGDWATTHGSDLKTNLLTQTISGMHNTTYSSLADYSSNGNLSHEMPSPMSAWDPITQKDTKWHPAKAGTSRKYRMNIDRETGEKMMLPVHPSLGMTEDDSDLFFSVPPYNTSLSARAFSSATYNQPTGPQDNSPPILSNLISNRAVHTRYPPSSYKGPNSSLVRIRSGRMANSYQDTNFEQGKNVHELEDYHVNGMSTGFEGNSMLATQDSIPKGKGKGSIATALKSAREQLATIDTRFMKDRESDTASMYSQDGFYSNVPNPDEDLAQQNEDVTKRFSTMQDDGSYNSSFEGQSQSDDASVSSIVHSAKLAAQIREKKNSDAGIPNSINRIATGIRTTGSSQADLSSSPYNLNNSQDHTYDRPHSPPIQEKVLTKDNTAYDRCSCPKFPLEDCYLGLVFGKDDVKSAGTPVTNKETINGKVWEDAYCFVHKRKEFGKPPRLPNIKEIAMANIREWKASGKYVPTSEQAAERELQKSIGRAIIFSSLSVPILGCMVQYKIWRGREEVDQLIQEATGKRILWFGEEEVALAGWVLVVELAVLVLLVALLVAAVLRGWF